MDLMSMATDLLSEQLGGGDGNQLQEALSGLLGNGGESIDIGGLVGSLMSQGGLEGVVGSWLGDGANEGITGEQLQGLFDAEVLAGFAGKLGLDSDSALAALSAVIPNLVDRSSSGGSLLDEFGGIDGVMDFARKLF